MMCELLIVIWLSQVAVGGTFGLRSLITAAGVQASKGRLFDIQAGIPATEIVRHV